MNTPERWQSNISGSELTSLKVGGPVRHFSKPRNLDELREDLKAAAEGQLPVRLLGGGSNLILPDEGFSGLLIKPNFTTLRILDAAEHTKYDSFLQELHNQRLEARYAAGAGEEMLQLKPVSEERNGETVLVEMGAGVPWGQAVMWSLQQGLAGLHWYARIPCQVGGAIYNNIHGEKHFVGEVIAAVKAVNWQGEEMAFHPLELHFGYDYSRFHNRQEIITAGIFALTRVLPDAAPEKAHYLDWTAEKSRVQPSGANCGSVFQNLSPEQQEQAGQEAVAAAWYIDRCDLKGEKRGGMQVYPGHANFIVNDGTGTQQDFIALVRFIRETVHEKYGIWLEPEAECMTGQGEKVEW